MFSQSLLLDAWRETAALPDSSDSTQAETTPLSSPVSAASWLTNVFCAEVNMPSALAGTEVAVAAVVPVSALERLDEKDIDAPVLPPADDDDVVDVAAACGVKAVARLESWELICATRAVTSE